MALALLLILSLCFSDGIHEPGFGCVREIHSKRVCVVEQLRRHRQA